ncbi:NFACT RNA binding domain-containing protein [Desulfonatronospira sp. MSAO_Bac3]|uniref:NFACT RNA binding domain-containing protein n=1 Tax=Desulfonatronospira sp. MSAO_Bac3 TaxID=2293857 RepID=UPI000FF2F7D3|nr:NFACT RNA binding domain-containing protein [Desulfonatronospira sp. MSAO_Bac3]RQD74430.1 MAG: DUF814 domain-containing protein [Desulfonatronospira sp. MSAO_Bac3]
MEANFFRFAVQELFDKVQGVRIEKVYMPGRDIYTLDMGKRGNLILACSRKQGFFTLSSTKPPNPSKPPAQAMRLRKHIKNRRILDMISMWPERRIFLRLFAADPVWLELDLVRGLSVVDDPGVSPEDSIAWPDLESFFADKEIWKTHPQLTPPLRQELTRRSPDEAGRLLQDLAAGRPEGFFICEKGPDRLGLSCFRITDSDTCREFDSALEACAAFAEPGLQSLLDAPIEKAREKEEKKKSRKLQKKMQQIQEDHKRLLEMTKLEDQGKIIQNNLYQLDPEQKTAGLRLKDHHGLEHELELDPGRTVRENMQWFFKRARKGKRGLEAVSRRKNELAGPELGSHQADASRQEKESRQAQSSDSRSDLHRKAHVFRSSDGYTILRAKNSRVAGDLLRQYASWFDYWLHSQDGPGAHTILKRRGREESVPERTLEEAAVLAALASFQKNEGRARIMCALVKDVKPVKGAAPGRVKVDRVYKSLVVEPDPDLEAGLKVDKS